MKKIKFFLKQLFCFHKQLTIFIVEQEGIYFFPEVKGDPRTKYYSGCARCKKLLKSIPFDSGYKPELYSGIWKLDV